MLDVQCLVKSLHSGLRRGKILQEHSPDGPPNPSKPFSARTVLAARSSPRFLCGWVVKHPGCGAGVDDVVDDGGGEFGVALDGEDVGEWAGRGGERVGFEKGVDGVTRGGEQEGASRREGGHVVFVLWGVSMEVSMEIGLERRLPFARCTLYPHRPGPLRRLSTSTSLGLSAGIRRRQFPSRCIRGRTRRPGRWRGSGGRNRCR